MCGNTLRIGARLNKKCEGRMFVKKEGNVKQGNTSREMFAKSRRNDKKRRGKLTRRTLLYPGEKMKWIRGDLNRRSKS